MNEAFVRCVCRRVVFLLLLTFPCAFARAQTPPESSVPVSIPDLQKTADAHYAEKSYALALDDYRRLLPMLPKTSPERTVASYRIAVALGQSRKWDDAFVAIDQFLADHKDAPLWQARGLYQKGLLLNLAPQEGYRVGKKIYRGNDYPHTDSAETPEYVNLQDDDLKDAVTAFEQSLKDYEELSIALRPTVAPEESDLCLDLAKLLPLVEPWGSDDDWKAVKTFDWRIDPKQSYDASWPTPKKALYMYARVPTLNPADTHRTVLAALGKALYAAQYQEQWRRGAYQPPVGKTGDKDYWEGGYRIVQKLPYFDLDPVAILNRAASAYPNDEQAPQMRLLVAKWTENGQDYIQALGLYRALLTRYPHCRWADDANAGIQGIVKKTVTLNGGIQPANGVIHFNVASRNLKTLTFHAYSIPLETILNDPKTLNNEQLETTDFTSIFGSPSAAAKLGPQVAQWDEATQDRGDYAPVSKTINAPLTQRGAYIIVAEGDGGKVRGATLLIVSDLAVIRKTDKDNVLASVTDARSGGACPRGGCPRAATLLQWRK